MREQTDTFSTTDPHLAAYILIRLKIEPELIAGPPGAKGRFCFPRSEVLYKVISDYHCGAPVSAVDFAELSRRLRGQSLELRKRTLEQAR